jgi:hypothetical protein
MRMSHIFVLHGIEHATISCDEVSGEDLDVKFVEELWASPPRHVKEIAVKAGLPKAARPLFQVMEPLVVTRPTASGMKEAETSQGRGGRERM